MKIGVESSPQDGHADDSNFIVVYVWRWGTCAGIAKLRLTYESAGFSNWSNNSVTERGSARLVVFSLKTLRKIKLIEYCVGYAQDLRFHSTCLKTCKKPFPFWCSNYVGQVEVHRRGCNGFKVQNSIRPQKTLRRFSIEWQQRGLHACRETLLLCGGFAWRPSARSQKILQRRWSPTIKLANTFACALPTRSLPTGKFGDSKRVGQLVWTSPHGQTTSQQQSRVSVAVGGSHFLPTCIRVWREITLHCHYHTSPFCF